jgi:hypothetical protein
MDSTKRAANYHRQNSKKTSKRLVPITAKQRKRLSKKANASGKRSVKWHDWL